MGNLIAVTAASARTSEPSGHSSARRAGKGASAGGETLPASSAVVAAQDLERSLRRLSDAMAASQRNLSFRVDKRSGRTVITVVDAATKEVIRQIPSEDVLAVSQALEAFSGVLDARA